LNAITNFINPRSTIQIHLSGIQYVIVLKNQSRLFHPTSSITLIFFQNDNNALIPHLRPATTAATNSSSPPVRAACQVRAYQDCRCWLGGAPATSTAVRSAWGVTCTGQKFCSSPARRIHLSFSSCYSLLQFGLYMTIWSVLRDGSYKPLKARRHHRVLHGRCRARPHHLPWWPG
jgi:hypothetical protein